METYENQCVDNTQSRQFSNSQSGLVSTRTQDQKPNKNIEKLKKLQKTKENFNKIYDILKNIAMEKDFDAMQFAVNEKFCDVRNDGGQTISDISIEYNNYELARLIAEYDGNNSYNSTNPKFIRFGLKTQRFDIKKTFVWASAKGHYDIVKLLLTVPGIDVNAKYSFSPLDFASLNGHHKIVKLLLTVPGIDVKPKDNFRALGFASLNGHYKVVKRLLAVPGMNQKTILESLSLASVKRRHDIVKLLLTVPGISLNAKGSGYEDILITPSWYGYHEVVKLFLTVPGIDINAKDNRKETALMKASFKGHHEVVKLLLTVPGIDIHIKNKHNETALMIAAFKGHYEVVKLILAVPGIENNREELLKAYRRIGLYGDRDAIEELFSEKL